MRQSGSPWPGNAFSATFSSRQYVIAPVAGSTERRDMSRKHAKQQNAEMGMDTISTATGKKTTVGMSRKASDASSITPIAMWMRPEKTMKMMPSTAQATRLPTATLYVYASESLASAIFSTISGGISTNMPLVYVQSSPSPGLHAPPSAHEAFAQLASASPS